MDLDRRGGCGGLGKPVSGWAGAIVKCGAEVSSRDSGLLGLTTPLAAPAFSPLASRVQVVSVQRALQATRRRGNYFPASGDVAFLRNSKGLLGDPLPQICYGSNVTEVYFRLQNGLVQLEDAPSSKL